MGYSKNDHQKKNSNHVSIFIQGLFGKGYLLLFDGGNPWKLEVQICY